MMFPSHPRIEPKTFWEFYWAVGLQSEVLAIVPTLPLTAESMATWLTYKRLDLGVVSAREVRREGI